MLLLGLGRDDGGEAGARGGDARLGGVVRARGAVERQLVCDEGVVRRLAVGEDGQRVGELGGGVLVGAAVRLPPLDGEAVPDAARLEPGAGVEPGRRRE